MQYPQIQFYRGSLVRLASGELKQVEDLSSDDFLESARLISNSLASPQSPASAPIISNNQQQFNYILSNKQSQMQQVDGRLARTGGVQVHDENNNSVFNSPEPTSSHFDSPTMETEEDEDEDIDVELDVVTNFSNTTTTASEQLIRSNSNSQNRAMQPVDETAFSPSTSNNNNINQDENEGEDFYIDSSVVRDFHEFGPPCSTSPASSTGSLNPDLSSMPSTSTSSSSSSSTSSSSSSLVISPPVASTTTTRTVLIKFFLETSRSIAFIEVPIEHPFFVFHRGWSSWNPQLTYDKFGLKCRKLKIGDTCISLIRRNRKHNQHHQHQNLQQDSDQCNILFSSIKIH